MPKLRAFALLVLCLSAVAPCFADTFQVTFWTEFGYSPIPPLSPERPAQGIIAEIFGSFLWDTSTNTFSNPNITDNLGQLGLNDHYTQLNYAWFLTADNIYGDPAGTMAGFTWYDPVNSMGIQFSPGDHAFLGQQVEPRPGTYYTGMWFMFGPGFGDPPASDYWLTVAPVATPEPASATLVVLGLFGLVSITRRRRGT
jgi:hypothetical protein